LGNGVGSVDDRIDGCRFKITEIAALVIASPSVSADSVRVEPVMRFCAGQWLDAMFVRCMEGWPEYARRASERVPHLHIILRRG
jgi:hypothetical protein